MSITGVSDQPKPVGGQGPEVSGSSQDTETSVPSQYPEKPGHSLAKPQQQSRIGKRAITFYVSPDAFRQLRVLSAQTDRTIQELMQEALDWQFQQHDMHRIARE
jgi:hypothetical protein